MVSMVRRTLLAILFVATACVAEEETLHAAVRDNEIQKLKELLTKGADVNGVDRDGVTPLHYAAMANEQEAAEVLLAAKAFLEPEVEGRTPLYLAVREGHLEMVKLLLAAKANPNTSKHGAWSVLHLAAKDGTTPIVEELLRAKAELEAVNWDGETPLHLAAKEGFNDIVKLLLDAGANVGAKDKAGKTPLDCAKEAKRDKTVGLLAAAKVGPVAAAPKELRWQWQALPPGKPTRTKLERPVGVAGFALTEKDGLPSPAVAAITQVKDGAMVFGTDQGLSILRENVLETYTGKASRPEFLQGQFSHREIPGNSWLPSNWITAVYGTRDGALWVGTMLGTCRAKNGQWQVLKLTTPVNHMDLGRGLESVTTIHETASGKTLMGSHSLGVTLIDEARNDLRTLRSRGGKYEGNALMDAGFVTSFAEEAGGTLWIGTFDGLLRYDGKDFKEYVQEPWLPDRTVRSLCLDRAGNLWIGTHKGVGVRMADGTARLFTKADILLDNNIWHLTADREGRVWAATGKGYCLFDGKRWTYPVSKSLNNFMGPLFLAADGALWFATEEGVIRDPQMEFKLTNPVTEALAEQKAKIEKEFPNVAPSPLNAKDAKGRIWVGREDGVDVYDGKTWTTMPLELGEATLSLVKADSKGRIWIGTQGAGLIGFEGDRQVRYNRDPQQGGAYVYSLTENRNGTLFAGTQGGLFIQEGEACRRQEGLEELGCQQIVLIAADDKDRIWMADGNYGLFLFDGKSTRHLSQKDPLQGRQVVDLLPLKDGKMRVKTLSRAEKGTEEKSFDCDGRQCLPVAE